MLRKILITACVLFVPLPVRAEAPRLSLPVACTLGETCRIQSYVDADPTEGAVDYTCGGLSYDGHKGTDFALPTYAEMKRGVAVRAAAAGRVRATRDGMIDRVFAAEHEAEMEGRDCGNGVVIAHPDGWETQYCHMRQGSVRVATGQMVEAGETLGLVGLSGRTQFPHVHLSLRHEGKVVDPFRPDAKPGECGLARAGTLWANPPAYVPGGLIEIGFATGIPKYSDIKAGRVRMNALPTDAPAIVVWAFGYGSRPGDIMTLRIEGPQGEVFAKHVTLDKAQAQYFRASGLRLRKPLPTGTYAGIVTLSRGGSVLVEHSAQVAVR